MKYISLLLAFQIITLVCFSQVRGVVLNKVSQQPVPYANIALEGKSYGTTSDLKGYFVITQPLANSRIVISAIGYSTAFIDAKDDSLTIMLEPRLYLIDEVEIKRQRGRKTLIVDKLDKKTTNSFASNGYSWITAKYFQHKPNYNNFPFVKQISILTTSYISSAKFNVRLLAANEEGEPYEEILNENLIVTARRGKRTVTIDIGYEGIQFPINGLFVALEWLIIDENKHEYSYTPRGQKKKKNSITYEPKFMVNQKYGESKSWGYHGGSWHKRDYTQLLGINSYFDLAIELLLTD